MKNIYPFFVVLLALFLVSCADDTNTIATVKVSNPTAEDRMVETVEIPWEKLPGAEASMVKVMAADKELPRQLIYDHDKVTALIFQVKLNKNETQAYKIVKGEPTEYPSKAYAMVAKDRYDDFGWENDRIAYRTYSDKLIPIDGPSGGIDVWVKSVRKLVIDRWFAGKDYHNDHGEGCDSYKVGHSLGAGSFGFMHDGQLFQHSNYTKVDILANGPIRMQAKLSFPAVDIAGNAVVFTKTITLDAGQNLNKYTIDYKSDMSGLEIASGAVLRKEGDIVFANDHKTLAYWEGQNKNHGHTGIGVIFPYANTQNLEQDNHALLLQMPSGDSFVYYSGACWSKANRDDETAASPDSKTSWEAYLDLYLFQLENPLSVNIE